MSKYDGRFRLKYRYEEDGFSISNYESKNENYVTVKYEKDVSFYTCNNSFESACLVHSLLIEYNGKKKIVENILDSV